MTKLEAVNEILRRCGGLPVPSLDTGGASAASQAERTLDAQSLAVQTARGWVYNTVRNHTITRDGNNKAPIPTGTITIDGDGADQFTPMEKRGGFLYDLKNETFAWDYDPEVQYVTLFDFACIPPPIQHFIATKSARDMLMQRGDTMRYNGLQEDFVRAEVAMNQYEGDQADASVLDTSWNRQLRGRERPSQPWGGIGGIGGWP